MNFNRFNNKPHVVQVPSGRAVATGTYAGDYKLSLNGQALEERVRARYVGIGTKKEFVVFGPGGELGSRPKLSEAVELACAHGV